MENHEETLTTALEKIHVHPQIIKNLITLLGPDMTVENEARKALRSLSIMYDIEECLVRNDKWVGIIMMNGKVISLNDE